MRIPKYLLCWAFGIWIMFYLDVSSVQVQGLLRVSCEVPWCEFAGVLAISFSILWIQVDG